MKSSSVLYAGLSTAVTAYRLPFEFLYTAQVFSNARSTTLEVSCSQEIPDATVSDLDSIVTTFYMLASAGALGGDVVAPWTSTVTHPTRPERADRRVRWHFESTRLAEPAVTILAQLLSISALEAKIERVLFTHNGPGCLVVPLESDPRARDWYPRVWPDLRFGVDVADEFNESIELRITFHEGLTLAEQQAINVELLTWAAAASLGAYGVAPVSPELCGLVPEEVVRVTDNELWLGFQQTRCHPAAFRALVNVCAAIDHHICPIVDLDLG